MTEINLLSAFNFVLNAAALLYIIRIEHRFAKLQTEVKLLIEGRINHGQSSKR